MELRTLVEGWSEKELCQRFGRGFNETQRQYDSEGFAALLALIAEVHGSTIRAWKDAENNTCEQKAYKKLAARLSL